MQPTNLFACGFLSAASGQAPDNFSAVLPLSLAAACALQVDKVFSGGWGFALASTVENELCCWGCNQPTLLKKSGNADDGADPSAIEIVAEDVETAAAGFDHALVVLKGGKLAVFGPHVHANTGPYLSMVNVPIPVAMVAAGEHHSIFLTTNGDVYAFGGNREGQLGCVAGTQADNADAGFHDAQCVLGPATDQAPVTLIAAGARHSMAVTTDGQCFVWGWNLHGQCGTGEPSALVAAPTRVETLGPLVVVGIAAGMAHSLMLTDAGAVMACGGNADGQLGSGDCMGACEPRLVEGAEFDEEHVVKVAAGARHSVAMCRSGAVYTWGCGRFGAVGTGARENVLTPRRVTTVDAVVDIGAGWWHTLMVVSKDGKMQGLNRSRE